MGRTARVLNVRVLDCVQLLDERKLLAEQVDVRQAPLRTAGA